MSERATGTAPPLPRQPSAPIVPFPSGPVPVAPAPPPRRQLGLTVNGRQVAVPEGATLLRAAQEAGVEIPTLCFLETLTPVNVCRICVVELEGSRTLVPACSRKAEEGMVVRTDSDRVRLSRRLVLEFLASSADVTTSPQIQAYLEHYGARPDRFGPPQAPSATRDAARAGWHAAGDGSRAASVAQPVKADNELYVRDYGKCVLCYKCVEACGTDAQNTFAIAVAGRGFDARISTEYAAPLPESACVYCGNCIGVCPTGALMFASEYQMRRSGTWDEARQTSTDTICPYCGVGCTLTLQVQDRKIVRVGSPLENDVTRGHLCIKGRFGWQYVQIREKGAAAP
ncbi:MAG TPA: 2Fe-2S iron-sulfur cluster-binding protein [Terriglobia bacterium]|nr:2Fe-2S iron-sulfur cluster-binding protein [Terriglobia bacterium]